MSENLRVYIRNVPDQGLDITGVIPPQEIDERHEDNFHFVKPVRVSAHVDKVEDILIVKAKVESEYGAVCGRCLAEFVKPWSSEFILDFPIEKQAEYIELTEDIRQEAILSYPLRTICRDDCRGFCLKCGANLNNERCTCGAQK